MTANPRRLNSRFSLAVVTRATTWLGLPRGARQATARIYVCDGSSVPVALALHGPALLTWMIGRAKGIALRNQRVNRATGQPGPTVSIRRTYHTVSTCFKQKFLSLDVEMVLVADLA